MATVCSASLLALSFLIILILLVLEVMGLSYFKGSISVNCYQLGMESHTGRLETPGLAATDTDSLLGRSLLGRRGYDTVI
jgi:hypothetical protein